jgi:ectoine hydroxylase-related dioxygenase (phytanoyl-CoA dioxygenase family)
MIDRDGYAVREGVLSPTECAAILADIALAADIGRAGVRNLMRYAQVAQLANDARLLLLAEELTGLRLMPFKAILFNKTGKANWLVAWHQDTALPVEKEVTADGWGPISTKEGVIFSHAPADALNQILALRIHLDASTSANGPLRVIPGSHGNRISDDAELRKIVDTGPHVELTVGLGGVIAMSPMLVHASSKSLRSDPRPVLHIEYTPSLDITHGAKLATS